MPAPKIIKELGYFRINNILNDIALQRQIDATDKQIDKLVYKLYGLTEEEIKIIEGSFT